MTRATPGSLATRPRRPGRLVSAYVGLGANVGDPTAMLVAAVAALAALPGVRLRAVSRLYATAPVGVIDQPPFRNAVVALAVPRGPDPGTGAVALLVALKGTERAFGRRHRQRWGPRELDLDLLVFGRHQMSLERPPAGLSIDQVTAATPGGKLLILPHPEAHERLFVLAPLADIAPGLVPPGWHETVKTARDRRERIEGTEAAVVVGSWDEDTRSWAPTATTGSGG